MNVKKKVISAVVGGLAIAGFVAATTLALPQISAAQTETPPAASQAAVPEKALTDRMGRGGPVENSQYLADALGITQDELAAARTKAHEAAIAQAVKDGLITQEQADAMLNKTGDRTRGVRIDLRGANIDQEKLLADALGISVEKLQAAEETAAKAELAQAVTDGRITQEQADQITAERALQKYITEKGFFKSAVESAVSAGVITQAQADTILSKLPQGGLGFGFGPRGMDGPGGHGGRGGHGGGRGPEMGGTAPAAPAAPAATSS